MNIVRHISLFLAFTLFSAAVIVAQPVALAPEVLVKETELYPYEGILPSPDGKWVVFEASDPAKKIRFDYEGQRFLKTGYPMLTGASAMGLWVTELASGKSFQLSSPEGSSWSANWSPDGKRLAFYSDRGGQAALWVWDRETRTAKQVSPAFIYFSWWRERPLWSADGKTILCKILPEGMSLDDVLKLSPVPPPSEVKATEDPTKPTVHVYSFHPGQESKPKEAEGSADAVEFTAFYDAFYLSDLAQIDVTTGAIKRLVKRVRAMAFNYSPDQRQIGFMSVDGTTPRTQQIVYTIRVYSMRDQKTQTIATGHMDPNNLTNRFTWSPDGTRIAYSDTGKTAERAAYVVELKSTTKTKLSGAIPEASRDFSWGPPLWDKTGTHIVLVDSVAGRLWEVTSDGSTMRELWKLSELKVKDVATSELAGTYWTHDDGKTMFVRTHDDSSKRDGIYAVRLETGDYKKIYEGDESISLAEMGALTGTPAGSPELIYCSQSAMRPVDLWSLDVNSGKTSQLSNLNPQFNDANMGRVRIIDFYSLQNEHLRGALLLPAAYREGTSYPMVVWIYGGDMGSDKANRFAFGWGSAFNPQMWASRGYAVLYPDIPLHPGTPVEDLVSAVIPAVNKAIELGIADSNRLAVMGQSFGGYNTIALLTRTSMFKAAVATSAAPTDLFMAYSYFMSGGAPSEGYYEEGQGGMKGSPWEFKMRYFENSPFFSLDRVTTPLMIERGSTDLISRESGNVYNALKREGKEVEFLEYEHEEHVLQQPVNVIDFWNRRTEWVSSHFDAATRPDAKTAAKVE
jgi:dipeptidyl aminopeptidase/acylaminoacyl peptidase